MSLGELFLAEDLVQILQGQIKGIPDHNLPLSGQDPGAKSAALRVEVRSGKRIYK